MNEIMNNLETQQNKSNQTKLQQDADQQVKRTMPVSYTHLRAHET